MDRSVQNDYNFYSYEDINLSILRNLRSMLFDYNHIAQVYQEWGSRWMEDVSLRLKSGIDKQYHVPVDNNEIALIIPGDGSQIENFHDIIVRKGDTGECQSIPADHQAYDALLYVLLFPTGSSGYYRNMVDINNKRITMLQFYRWVMF